MEFSNILFPSNDYIKNLAEFQNRSAKILYLFEKVAFYWVYYNNKNIAVQPYEYLKIQTPLSFKKNRS